MLHRHPLLSSVTLGYLVFVGWVTLTPAADAPSSNLAVLRVLARLQRDHRLSWLTYHRAEFLANVALFVPVGLFLLLLVGTRFWWVAALAAMAMTSAIESVQHVIPGRVPDERDLVANTAGALIGIVAGTILTWPASVRRNRRRREAAPARVAR